ncbi:unnamed protein product [Paramecium sonneborni]|uniref:Uncharacterized protein n=1 Tax=Paramecium sonneborni TaxID=65129 RepID=A0A8S1R5J7_9CILI|nr:unnamed protein product [Paramecium sonneborni]
MVNKLLKLIDQEECYKIIMTDMSIVIKQINLYLGKREKLETECAEKDLLLQRGGKQPYNI